VTAAETLTSTASTRAGRLPTAEVRPVTLRRVVRSEWIKLRSIRSTVVVSALTVLFMVVIGLLVPYFRWKNGTPLERAHFQSIDSSLTGVHLALLTVGILGVLVITGEYTTGMIRATLGAVPRRLPVLLAKAAVFAPVTFVLALVSSLAAFLGGQALVAPHGASLGSPGALRAVFGVALFLTVMGLLGLAIGFLTRTTAGGIAAVVGLTFVLQAIAAALPTSWQAKIMPYLPVQAGQALYITHRHQYMLHPWPGFALFCGYTAVAMILAAVALRRRDA
jgi:ABC-2 type transport system permease protein